MKNKNISILLSSLSFGGAERVVSILLNEFHKQDYEVTLVLMDKTIKYDIPEKQKIIYLDNNDLYRNTFFKFLKIPFLAWKYKNLCRTKNIDTSISFMNRSNYINIVAKLLGNKVKTIISERTVSSKAYQTNSLKDIASRTLIKVLYPYADKLIANSFGIKNDLIKSFKLSNSLITVIHNPIDLEYIKALSQQRDELIEKNKFTFITVGRLHTVKNHSFLLDVFKDIDANLIIIGEGEEKKALEDKIRKYNLQDRVRLLGKQSNPFQYLVQADCFLLSSKYEGFPNVILEAFACNLPAICTNCEGGTKEIISDYKEISDNQEVIFEKYGVLVPLNNIKLYKDAVLKLMNDEVRKSFLENIQEKLKEYNKEKIFKSYLDAIGITNESDIKITNTSDSFWEKYSKTDRSVNSLMNLESDEEKARKKFELEQQHIEKILNFDKNEVLVDLGAGIGLWAEYFSKKTKHVYLVEKQAAFVEKAKLYHEEKGNNNIDIILSDIIDFSLDENSVDYVFISGVTIYLDTNSLEKLIEKIKYYLKPSGKIIHRDAYGREEQYVVNNYSEALRMNYSALYRTREEYDDSFVKKYSFKKSYDEDMYAGGDESPFNKWKETRLRLACYVNQKGNECK